MLVMFDLKYTSVFMYKAAIHRHIFFLGWFWGSNCNETCDRKFCSLKDLVYKCKASPHVKHYRCSKLFFVTQ